MIVSKSILCGATGFACFATIYVLTWSDLTYVQDTAQCLSSQSVSKLAAKQSADFLPDYLNETMNDGIRPPPDPQPFLDYAAMLTADQKQFLSKFLPREDRLRRDALRSLYAMDGERSWLDHIESMPDTLLFPLTKLAQKLIHEHQNPSSCKGKKYIKQVARSTSGIGAAMHDTAWAIGLGLYHDRIAVYDTDSIPLAVFVDPVNGSQNPFSSIFQELSPCQQYANASNTLTIYDFRKSGRATSPVLAQAMLNAFTDMTPNALALWARAQHVAYAMRLRPRTLTRLAQLRLKSSMHQGFTAGKDSTTGMPFPLPKRTWSMHVRHGDKSGEMHLVPFTKYVEDAEQFSMQNPVESRKWAFVSSEDPEVFEEMKSLVSLKQTETVSNIDWQWLMSNIERQNSGPIQQLATFGTRTETTISWLLQLMIALDCDGFVGTRGSNWNSLVEELRGVWASAARGPYIEVARERDWLNYPA